MNIQPEELDGLDHEETDVQEVETTVAQVPEVPVMEVPEESSVQVPDVPDQELVVTPPIPVVVEPSTQEVEEVEMLDIEDDESLVVENRSKQSKIKKILNYLTSKKKRTVLRRAFHVWRLKRIIAPDVVNRQAWGGFRSRKQCSISLTCGAWATAACSAAFAI